MVTDIGVGMSLLQCTHVVYYASNVPGGAVQKNRRCERHTGRVFMNLCILCESEEVNGHSLRCREISVDISLETSWHSSHLLPLRDCGVKKSARHRSSDGAVTGIRRMGGQSELFINDLEPHVTHEMTSAISPGAWTEGGFWFVLGVSITSSASAASCCEPEVRDGLSCDIASISSVGRMVWTGVALSFVRALTIAGEAVETRL